ncbi:hypothetical protein [Roseomonas marmotae]|uniref:Uncharacterized protein n=1 Tax=Roseomonas marmotae TaxID=2768161 RepID=A0ABS3K947_9PROT|nr:hypothetical protein [Roseomonas marmotae]MBO1073965.1 hypothetical protein [Roseomonas marmotae]QTI78758.1 hypothetical protein IAI58_14000 [Roseomonas marmotae]
MSTSISLRPVPGRPIIVDAGRIALERIEKLIETGGSPERVAREVETIITVWRMEAIRQPDEVRERLAACCDHLGAGVHAARGRVGAVDVSDSAALRHGARSLAAMIAARDTMSSAYEVI